MVVKFVRDEGKGPAPEDAGTVNVLPTPSRQLLDRHGARVLDPATAFAIGGRPAPRSTIFRPGVLLIPSKYLEDPAVLEAINRVLAEVAMFAVPADQRDGGGESQARAAAQFPDLPLRATLHLREDAKPNVVDAWKAVQYLRNAAQGEEPELDPEVANSVSIEHLFFSNAAFGGVPWDTSGVDGTPWDTSGYGPGSSYGRTRGANRIPVTLQMSPPARTKCETRRAVVAVLDTGIGPHPWFGLKNRANLPAPGSGLLTAPDIQAAIKQTELDAGISVPTQLIGDVWDAPASGQPLIGDLDTDTGHGLFIAGIIRQSAPEADVLAIRIIHSDGVAYEADVLLALHLLADRIRDAEKTNRPERMVDVLSLSLGYFEETPADTAYTTKIGEAIAELTGLGVLVVAAAGNDATTRRFYPAGFADQPVATGSGPQVISVGALNPNTTKALFSNEGPWVRCWATGAAIVSTYPTDIRGSGEADREVPDLHRASLDPDDYSAGFAVWDGTSFAAPLAAAAVTNALVKTASHDSGFKLTTIDRETVVKRAWAALGSL